MSFFGFGRSLRTMRAAVSNDPGIISDKSKLGLQLHKADKEDILRQLDEALDWCCTHNCHGWKCLHQNPNGWPDLKEGRINARLDKKVLHRIENHAAKNALTVQERSDLAECMTRAACTGYSFRPSDRNAAVVAILEWRAHNNMYKSGGRKFVKL